MALRRGAATRRTASRPTLSDGCATKRGGWRDAAPRDSPMRDGTERASSAEKDSVVDAPLTEVGALARCWTDRDIRSDTHCTRCDAKCGGAEPREFCVVASCAAAVVRPPHRTPSAAGPATHSPTASYACSTACAHASWHLRIPAVLGGTAPPEHCAVACALALWAALPLPRLSA